MDWQKFITSDPKVLVGKPVIRGTRLSVEFIVGRLANGWTEQDLLDNYSSLTKESIQAVYAYAHDLMQEVLHHPPLKREAA